MSKTARVLAALNGHLVDRPPVSAWWHDYKREWSAPELAEATIEAYERYDWDFIKVNPRFSYYAEPWGAEYQRYDDRLPQITRKAIESPEDLGRIRAVDGTSGPFAEQLEALRLIADGVGVDPPLIQTVFTPLAVTSFMTGSPKYVQRLMREHPAELETALDGITQTLVTYVRACLSAGVSGIFFATVDWGTADNISWEDYQRFGRSFDLRVLEAAAGAPFNVMHVCRDNNHLLRMLDYPVAAFNWDVHGRGNPAFTDVLSRTTKAVMGGVRQSTMLDGNPGDVTAEAHKALAETEGSHCLLTPGCSIDPLTPAGNLQTLAAAAVR